MAAQVCLTDYAFRAKKPKTVQVTWTLHGVNNVAGILVEIAQTAVLCLEA